MSELVAHLVSPLAFQRPDDAARCVLALDAWGQVRLRDCVLARRRPWLAEIRDRTYAMDHLMEVH